MDAYLMERSFNTSCMNAFDEYCNYAPDLLETFDMDDACPDPPFEDQSYWNHFHTEDMLSVHDDAHFSSKWESINQPSLPQFYSVVPGKVSKNTRNEFPFVDSLAHFKLASPNVSPTRHSWSSQLLKMDSLTALYAREEVVEIESLERWGMHPITLDGLLNETDSNNNPRLFEVQSKSTTDSEFQGLNVPCGAMEHMIADARSFEEKAKEEDDQHKSCTSNAIRGSLKREKVRKRHLFNHLFTKNKNLSYRRNYSTIAVRKLFRETEERREKRVCEFLKHKRAQRPFKKVGQKETELRESMRDSQLQNECKEDCMMILDTERKIKVKNECLGTQGAARRKLPLGLEEALLDKGLDKMGEPIHITKKVLLERMETIQLEMRRKFKEFWLLDRKCKQFRIPAGCSNVDGNKAANGRRKRITNDELVAIRLLEKKKTEVMVTAAVFVKLSEGLDGVVNEEMDDIDMEIRKLKFLFEKVASAEPALTDIELNKENDDLVGAQSEHVGATQTSCSEPVLINYNPCTDFSTKASAEKFCFCELPSIGSMICCGNENCDFGKWFHFQCVGIIRKPSGEWQCPGCRQDEEYRLVWQGMCKKKLRIKERWISERLKPSKKYPTKESGPDKEKPATVKVAKEKEGSENKSKKNTANVNQQQLRQPSQPILKKGDEPGVLRMKTFTAAAKSQPTSALEPPPMISMQLVEDMKMGYGDSMRTEYDANSQEEGYSIRSDVQTLARIDNSGHRETSSVLAPHPYLMNGHPPFLSEPRVNQVTHMKSPPCGLFGAHLQDSMQCEPFNGNSKQNYIKEMGGMANNIGRTYFSSLPAACSASLMSSNAYNSMECGIPVYEGMGFPCHRDGELIYPTEMSNPVSIDYSEGGTACNREPNLYHPIEGDATFSYPPLHPRAINNVASYPANFQTSDKLDCYLKCDSQTETPMLAANSFTFCLKGHNAAASMYYGEQSYAYGVNNFDSLNESMYNRHAAAAAGYIKSVASPRPEVNMEGTNVMQNISMSNLDGCNNRYDETECANTIYAKGSAVYEDTTIAFPFLNLAASGRTGSEDYPEAILDLLNSVLEEASQELSAHLHDDKVEPQESEEASNVLERKPVVGSSLFRGEKQPMNELVQGGADAGTQNYLIDGSMAELKESSKSIDINEYTVGFSSLQLEDARKLSANHPETIGGSYSTNLMSDATTVSWDAKAQRWRVRISGKKNVKRRYKYFEVVKYGTAEEAYNAALSYQSKYQALIAAENAKSHSMLSDVEL